VTTVQENGRSISPHFLGNGKVDLSEDVMGKWHHSLDLVKPRHFLSLYHL